MLLCVQESGVARREALRRSFRVLSWTRKYMRAGNKFKKYILSPVLFRMVSEREREDEKVLCRGQFYKRLTAPGA
jgi:hypothetical protein